MSSASQKASEVARHPPIEGFAAVCDATFLNQAGIPTIVYGPGSLLQAHGDDEWVSIDEVLTATKVYAITAMDWCSYRGGR